MTAARPDAKFSLDVPPELIAAITGGGTLAPPIDRNQAMQVAAVMRARNLIAGSIGKLPLRVLGPDFSEVTDTTYLVNTPPDPEIPQVVTIAMTVEDLMFYSVAWWRVTKFGWHGYPVEARWVPHSSVLVAQSRGLPPSRLVISPDELFPTPGDGGVVYIDGREVPDNELIRFDSPNPPLLRHAARAIRTCLLLDQAAALYAVDPVPLGYFSPEDPSDPPEDDDVQGQLDQWTAARRTHAWPYLPAGLKANAVQWNPEQLQLAAQRQHAVLDIARATGVDADYLEASSETGNSQTYANSEDKRQDLVDFTCDPYLTAIQQRLSMRDCLPRGYCADFDITGFVRGDTASRMTTYKTGLEVGAYTKPEIRRLERRRPLTPAELADSAPVSPTKPVPAQDVPVVDPAAPPAAPAGTQNTRQETPMMQRFAAGDGQTVRVRFTAADTQDFQVDTTRRTLTGLMVPYGAVGDNGNGKWRFAKDSIVWSDPSRVKLNTEHSNQLVAVGTRFQSTDAGPMGTFKFGRGPEATRALEDADDLILDGLSVEVEFPHPESVVPDPTDPSVNLVRNAILRGVALTGTPAFDDARVTSVKASRNQGVSMPEQGTTTAPAPAESFDFEGHLTAAVDRMAETHERLTTSLAESLGQSFSAAMRAALEDLPNPQAGGGPQPVRAARYTITREEPVYSLNGYGNSLVRDAWYSAREHDADARERLRRFRVQTDELAKYARSVIAFSGNRAQFTAVSTANAGQLIPPGYRPDLFIPMLNQQRPLVNALSQGTIENATPFVVPVFGSFSGATGDNVEGSNPSDGTLSFTTKTVTPGAISGILNLNREIADSSNPAIDQIALQAMRESYSRQTEGKVYTELNGPNGLGGTLTPGTAELLSTNPNGAYCIQTADGTALKLPVAIRRLLANYPFKRFAAPNSANIGQVPTSALATAVGSDNRPLFPSVGAMNDSGVGNAVQQGWYVDGMPFVPAWSVSGVVGANDTHVIITNSMDAWVWESPTLAFRFEEKLGPAQIQLALFGYFATHVLRPIGLAGIRMTAP
jgi:hypothetical protein